MTPVYAVVLIAGFVALLGWVALTAVGATVDGWNRADPETRFGPRGRFGIAGALGFGLAGMSATFAGWAGLWSFVAAIGGALFAVAVAARYGPGGPTGSG
jgi:hypothetical protein